MSRVRRISLVGRSTCAPFASVTRNPTRKRSWYSLTRPAELKERMILSRSSLVKPSTACASPGLSTRRVLLAAATLRFSSTTSGLFPGMCSDSNGSSAWPRRWKPHAARSAASTQAKAAREEPSNDHIDEPSGDHDDLLHRLAVREARHRVVSEGELLELLAPGGFRRAHVSAQLAVDLEDELDFVSFESCFHWRRPIRIKNISFKTKFSPEVMTDVRGYWRQYSE